MCAGQPVLADAVAEHLDARRGGNLPQRDRDEIPATLHGPLSSRLQEFEYRDCGFEFREVPAQTFGGNLNRFAIGFENQKVQWQNE